VRRLVVGGGGSGGGAAGRPVGGMHLLLLRSGIDAGCGVDLSRSRVLM
jgi:hypothetical protein